MKEPRQPRRLRRPSQPVAPQDPSLQAAHPAWHRRTWCILALWALVLAAYSNSFQSGMVFDNAVVIAQDARLRAVTPQNLRLILTEPYWSGMTAYGLYRPLTTFSYLLNYAVFGNGTNPGAALLAVRWYRTRKPLFFFLAFFFVALVPTSNLVVLIGSIMAERFVYLPSIGLAGCVVAAIYALGQLVSRQRLPALRPAWFALGLLCLACA